MRTHRLTALGISLLLVLAVTASGSVTGGSGRVHSTAAYFGRVRDAVLSGVRRDFAEGTGVATPAFRRCLEGRLRERLDPPTITGLAAVYRRPGGSAYAAQLLNVLASPLAARCGRRAWVPELTGAAAGLALTHDSGASVRRLGVTYGPYLGLRCSHPVRRRDCEKVGIDVVFRSPARRVVAIAGGRRIHLHTPGLHDGVRNHDWVGTFTGVRLAPTRAYELDAEPIYVAVELRVRFAGGRCAAARFGHVLLSPGWG